MTIDPDAVLATLTLEQKVSLLSGADHWHTVALPGVPVLRCSDGPAGVRGTSWAGPSSASFPCGTALGASFDPLLVEEVGAALGREARSKGAHVLLAPTVNLHRTPIGGRNFECMSEDPELTAQIAVGYIRGLQRERVAACIKHFVANDTEFERMTISSDVDERTLRELYLVPFERAVRPVDQGGADVRSLMSSYNRINGTYACDHVELLRGVLRDEWGFDGVVFSDWFGTHSAAAALEAGLDLEMPGPPRERGAALVAAVRSGEVGEHRVDESVRRLLALFEWAGVGESTGDETTDDAPATREVIRRAAIAGTVLLKNEGSLLPLGPAQSLALVGPNAERGHIQGGGSARVRAHRPVAILHALRSRGVEVVHAPGCSIAKRLPALRGDVHVVFLDADGRAVASERSERFAFLWQDAPAPGVDPERFGARITAELVPDDTGDWEIGLAAVGPAVLRVDGEVLIDLSIPQTGGTYFGQGSPELRSPLPLEAGRRVTVEVELGLTDRAMLRGLSVGVRAPEREDPLEVAVRAAASADVAVVVVGTNDDWETEGEDRTTIALPGRQDELVARVAAANPRTVVVVNAGSPVAMPWLDDVASVLQIWFPGSEVGNALADVLLGAAEPGGRLPVTFPRRIEDTPAFLSHPGEDGHARYAEGLFIGHRWYDARRIEPLFPFGHGLGYTTWTLDGVDAAPAAGGGVDLVVTATNTGERPGSTVVQVYLAPPAGGPRRPVRTLVGFAKVAAASGERATAHIRLPRRAFEVWSPGAHGWVLPDDHVGLEIGWSSRELPVTVEVVVPPV
jgi:beta-glucosidase